MRQYFGSGSARIHICKDMPPGSGSALTYADPGPNPGVKKA